MNFKKIFMILLLFYANFTFEFEAFHTLHNLINLIGATTIIFMNWKLILFNIRLIDKYMVYSLLLMSFLAIMSIVLPYLMGTNDFTFFRSIFFGTAQKALMNVAAVVLYIRIFKERASLEQFSKFYILTLLMYLITTFLFVLLPGVRDFWLGILYTSDLEIELLKQPQYASRIGIDGFAGFIQTFKFAFGVILSVYFLIQNNFYYKGVSCFYAISIAVLTIGTLLYGRIGSVVAVIAITTLIIYFLTGPENIDKALIVIASGLLVIVTLAIVSIFSENVRVWFFWAFELVITFVQEGEFSSNSTNILFEKMYFVPDLKSILVGNGLYTDPSGGYYRSTDVGFIRGILFYGTLFTGLMYTAVIIPIIGLKNYLLENIGKISLYFSFLLFILIVVFEIKGGIYHHFFATIMPFYVLTKHQNTVKTKNSI